MKGMLKIKPSDVIPYTLTQHIKSIQIGSSGNNYAVEMSEGYEILEFNFMQSRCNKVIKS
jgi:hypothetical protein